MKSMRLFVLVLFGLLVIASSTWAGNRPPADAVLMFRDGGLTIGDVFTINKQTVSLLTEQGLVTYKRADVSQVVFLEDANALVLSGTGVFMSQNYGEGDLYYVGGVWDGRPAGRWVGTFMPDPTDPMSQRTLSNITFHVERNGLPVGTLYAVTVSDGGRPSTKAGYTQSHEAGLVVGGTGEFAGCTGSAEYVVTLSGSTPGSTIEAYGVFRFDAVR